MSSSNEIFPLNENIIKQLIDENVSTYKISKSRIISDYRGEKGYTAAYNGRQFLELLQNADDAQTDKVLIILDAEKNILSIANNGIPFDEKGLRSVMLANVSPKNKREFIGNKGLGFRSILNWVISVKVKTPDYIFEFSPKFARKKFEEIIESLEEREQFIRNEKDLPHGEIPFAILAIPDYSQNKNNQNFITVIELNYKETEERQILEQIEAITPEVLLFLNHIHEIEIIGAGNLDKKIILTEDSITAKERVKVNELSWNIYNSGEKSLPNNKDAFYVYKIAWQDDLNDANTCFSTYFPTSVATHLPCLIHATFDLDPSRNHLNKSDENDFLLQQIANSLSEIAQEKLRNKVCADWKAFQFLSVDGKSENKLLIPFFKQIESLIYDSAIYPTVKGIYKNKSEIIFYGNEFSEWVIRNKVADYFENLLLPIPDNIKLHLYNFDSKYNTEQWSNIISEVTYLIPSIDERVNLIALLLNDPIMNVIREANLPLLLDEHQNVVSGDIEVFTLKQASISEYQIPDYVEIAFIDDTLYNKLEEHFANGIEKLRNQNEHKSRPLKRLISPIVNLGSNDITDVIRNTSRSFNNIIKEENVEIKVEIRVYINCLYNIFKKNPDRKGVLTDTIYVVNRKFEIKKSSDLFFGREYQIGKVTEKLFNGIYTDNEFIAGNEFWNLEAENTDDVYIEDFFVWLGVNKYTKFKTESRDEAWAWGDYSKFVFDNTGWPNNVTSTNFKIRYVENFETITSSDSFTIETLVAWIIKDRELFYRLDDHENHDSFEYYYNKLTRPISSNPSFFKYQIFKSDVAANLYFEFEFASLLGLKTVNAKHVLFISLGITENEVIEVLRRLDAKMSFYELEIEKVYSLLEIQQNEHSKARKIYQLAFNYFKNLTSTNFFSYTKQTSILAVKTGVKEYRPTEEVYYSDNTTLPSKIVEDYWIFDFPKRNGEKQVAEYFGVKTFKDIAIEINNNIEIHKEEISFDIWFNRIKPYILTYRLISISKENIEKTTVSSLKHVSIRLLSGLEYSINDGEFRSLLPNEFINKTKLEYFICADSSLSVYQLKNTPAFCEAFAEILCMLFEVNENKDDFRSIFKDDFDLRDTKYLIDTKMLNEKFDIACKLLGLSVNEIRFWKAVAKIENKEWLEAISSIEELQSIVLNLFEYALPLTYEHVNFETFENLYSFEFLKDVCKSLGITLVDININLSDFPGLIHWHKEKLHNAALDVEELWNKAFWLDLSEKSQTEQKGFESKRKEYGKESDLIIQEIAIEYRYEINVEYEKLIIAKLNTKHKINISKAELVEIEIKDYYSDKFADINFDRNELSAEVQSLFFFPNNEDTLRTELEKFIAGVPDDKKIDNNQEMDNILVNLIPTTLLNGVFSHQPPSNNTNVNNSTGSVHSAKTDRQKKNAGKRAEKIVKNKLVEMYPEGEVCWISGNSDDNRLKLDDSKGYDIRYKKNKTDNIWYYLEVKSTSGNSFIISSNEVNVGILNKQNYHIALVNGLNIYLIEDFFDDERIVEFNIFRTSSSIRPLNYEVNFIINY